MTRQAQVVPAQPVHEHAVTTARIGVIGPLLITRQFDIHIEYAGHLGQLSTRLKITGHDRHAWISKAHVYALLACLTRQVSGARGAEGRVKGET